VRKPSFAMKRTLQPRAGRETAIGSARTEVTIDRGDLCRTKHRAPLSWLKFRPDVFDVERVSCREESDHQELLNAFRVDASTASDGN
jgi:hypothetical protein